MDATTKVISLGDFINDCPDHLRVTGYYVSVGEPTGAEIVLGDNEYTTPLDDDLSRLNGEIDADGDWAWDGDGEPTDYGRNSIVKLRAFYQEPEEADRIKFAD